MSDDFLSRWSRRKIEARKKDPAVSTDDPVIPAPDEGVRGQAPAVIQAEPPPVPPEPRPPEPLPPVESLTPESDFTPFMKGEVDPGIRRQALKALFQDPRFNVMDGLDVYIDDYSKPDPLPEGWLEKMNMATRLGDYPARVEAERLAGEAAKKTAEEPAPQLGAEQIAKQEQVLGDAPKEAPADTPDAGSPPAAL